MARWQRRRVLAVVVAVLAMGLGLTAAALSTSTFAPSPASFDTVVDVERDGRAQRVRFDDLARETGTTALPVIRRDTLVFEGHYGGHARDSLSTSFSVAKSVTGLLAGIAVDEGVFGSVDDPVTEYLPGLARRLPVAGGRHLAVGDFGHRFPATGPLLSSVRDRTGARDRGDEG